MNKNKTIIIAIIGFALGALIYNFSPRIITEYTENKENNLAEELADCLPKSDLASHEKCNELLKKITDFDSCVAAGFSVLKSNPPQCATPDGRNFIQA